MSIDNGESGQVSHEAYCMKDSIEAKTNAEMNQKMGYFNSADMANSKPYPVQMNGKKETLRSWVMVPVIMIIIIMPIVANIL